jgi:hypothetical protein
MEAEEGIRILELSPGVEPGLYFCEHEGETCSPALSPTPPPAGVELHSPSFSSTDCPFQRQGAAPGGPAGRTAMSSCRDWMQLPVDGSAISEVDDEGQTSCKGWLNQASPLVQHPQLKRGGSGVGSGRVTWNFCAAHIGRRGPDLRRQALQREGRSHLIPLR